MVNELDLKKGPYITTFTGVEIARESTPQEWEAFGEMLKRIDEAKQWAIGDWLVDGKKHYGDKLYDRASAMLGYDVGTLRQYASLSSTIELLCRHNISFQHHREVSSIKSIEESENGKLALSDKTDYDKIEELLQTAEKEKYSVRELRDVVRRYKEEQQEYIRLANEPEKYSVIYADPPWKYTSGDQHTDETQETVIGTHYPSMTIKELCKVPVNKMAAENCVLFLWVTSPLLEECFDIIKAWGFKYKTSMVWDKVLHNVGNYVSVRHELLLICTRGTAPKVPKLVDSVYTEERTEHSKKPSYFRELVEELYPSSKRIELFARDKYDGWDVWGNEV